MDPSPAYGPTLCLAPAAATAILLGATGSSWRARRAGFEAVGIGAGIILLALLFAPLPVVIQTAALPPGSILAVWLLHAAGEWRFAPDRGQSGYGWALSAAVRPTLGAGFGAAAGFAPPVLWGGHWALPFITPPVLIAGILTARHVDRFIRAAAPLSSHE